MKARTKGGPGMAWTCGYVGATPRHGAEIADAKAIYTGCMTDLEKYIKLVTRVLVLRI